MKTYQYLKQGENNFIFRERNLKVCEGSELTISNIVINWRFENIEKDTKVKLIDSSNVGTDVTFEKGYWTFDDIKERLGQNNVSLNKNIQSNTCRIYSKDSSVNLGEVGLLLGFGANKVISRDAATNSGTVRINKNLEYITVHCDIVDNEHVLDRFGEPSKIICVLPIDRSQRLNGTSSEFDKVFTGIPLNSGSYKRITITIKDNLSPSIIKLYMTCDIEIKEK